MEKANGRTTEGRVAVNFFNHREVISVNRRRFITTTSVVLPGAGGYWAFGQQPAPTFRVKVDMVVLSFTVTDSKGKYINGLKHTDFRVLEDGIQQSVSTFAEGNKTPLQIL